MIRTDDASEIAGVCASANTSSIASEFGVVVEPMIASTFDSPISLRVFCTAVVVSEASSSTMYSTVLPATSFGHMTTVLRSGMPSDAAGPVAETVTPILTCANVVAANADTTNATLRVTCFFMASPCESGADGAPAGAMIMLRTRFAPSHPTTAGSARNPLKRARPPRVGAPSSA